MNAQRIFSLSLSLIAAAVLSACASENDTSSSKEPNTSLTEEREQIQSEPAAEICAGNGGNERQTEQAVSFLQDGIFSNLSCDGIVVNVVSHGVCS